MLKQWNTIFWGNQHLPTSKRYILLSLCSIEVLSLVLLWQSHHDFSFKAYQKGDKEDQEAIVRKIYGLELTDPNVTFALCRGTRSSPAVSLVDQIWNSSMANLPAPWDKFSLTGENIHRWWSCSWTGEIKTRVPASFGCGDQHKEDRIPWASAQKHVWFRNGHKLIGPVGMPAVTYIWVIKEINGGLLQEPQQWQDIHRRRENTIRLWIPVSVSNVNKLFFFFQFSFCLAWKKRENFSFWISDQNCLSK